MSRYAAEVATGAAVLVLAAGFAFYAAKGAGLTAGSGETYPLTASFRSLEGIGVGSDVRLAGVKVGTMTDIKLNPQTFMADATVQIRKEIQLPTDTAIVISSEGLLGGNYVELLPGGMPDNLAPGDEIEDTQGAVSLISLLMKFVGGQADSGAAPPAGAESGG
ncbi:outer membrane lipid asymmetry maintenance protein MlaD [Xinfangfangia pollutisoli]|uniref:outer membrane lipid asymmetry maintenance protein MlaD n=1 Tax=Xinfangfangia pollutisoli TaxID=2865960 RepID=UPI001CD223DC|nr:outer membrane lipid asymmetry maintenance protein MlaD [Xinfangfangia pollutisoli]